jgi:uncharacterized protein
MEKTFKVLSIDGGGILGLFPAKILQLVEEQLQKEHGGDVFIADFVDLVSGTSTGGVLALAIACKIPMAKIVQLYENCGPKVFRNSTGMLALLRQLCLGGKFTDRELKKYLEQVFKTKTIGSSNCLLCIPAFDFTHSTYAVFKFDHKEGNLSRHNNLLAIDVALATSAAPTYFPLAQIHATEQRQYIDGGVWANNPSLVAFLEASKYFVGPGKDYDHLQFLSIATPSPVPGNRPMLPRHRGFVSWARGLFEVCLIGQSEFADVFLNEIQDKSIFPIRYFRLHGPAIGPNQAGVIGMDIATRQSVILLAQYAADAYYRAKKIDEMISFWKVKKTYLTNC